MTASTANATPAPPARVTHEVIRPIPGSDHRAGDRIDASTWRAREKLERARYIKPIEDLEGLRARAELAEATIVDLEKEAARLRERNAELQARITELEAQLGGQGRGRAAAGARR